MAENNGGQLYRRRDGQSRAAAQEIQTVRDLIFGHVIQTITFRDHGPELEEWAVKSLEEANGLLAGVGDIDLRELLMQVQADPNFDILAALLNKNKDIPSDA